VLATIAASGTERPLIRGDVLFREGDTADCLYVVTRGRLAIVMVNEFDRRETVVSLMEPGDLFGEMAMLDDGPRSAMARALEPSDVLCVPYTAVLEAHAAISMGTSVSWSSDSCCHILVVILSALSFLHSSRALGGKSGLISAMLQL
jgi:CRP-like cAMP-binding protein